MILAREVWRRWLGGDEADIDGLLGMPRPYPAELMRTHPVERRVGNIRWPASNRVIREWFPASERGVANAIFGAGGAAGPALGSVVVTAIVSALGWRAGFFVAGGIG